MNNSQIAHERTIRIPNYDKLETLFTSKPTSESAQVSLQKVTPPNSETYSFRLWHGACNYADFTKDQALTLAESIISACNSI